MGKLALALVVLAGLLLGQHQPVAAQTPTTGFSFTVPAGWNLLALPAGTNLSAVAGPLYTWQPGDTSYEVIQPYQGTKNGLGYWVYFPTSTNITLSAGSMAPMQVTIGAGQWAMLGGPSGMLGEVHITGIDAAYSYDPKQGYVNRFGPQNCLPNCVNVGTGEGIWVYSTSGGVVTITPQSLPPP